MLPVYEDRIPYEVLLDQIQKLQADSMTFVVSVALHIPYGTICVPSAINVVQ